MSMTPSRRTLDAITLADLAADNRLFVVRCHLCRKTENYLAADLVKMMGPTKRANTIFTGCPHCGRSEYLNVRYRLPLYEDQGHLRVRRPIRVWHWTDAILGKD